MMRTRKFKVNIEVLLVKKEEFQLQLRNGFEVQSEEGGGKIGKRWLIDHKRHTGECLRHSREAQRAEE